MGRPCHPSMACCFQQIFNTEFPIFALISNCLICSPPFHRMFQHKIFPRIIIFLPGILIDLLTWLGGLSENREHFNKPSSSSSLSGFHFNYPDLPCLSGPSQKSVGDRERDGDIKCNLISLFEVLLSLPPGTTINDHVLSLVSGVCSRCLSGRFSSSRYLLLFLRGQSDVTPSVNQ